MKRTHLITDSLGKTHYVTASGRTSACRKLTGLRPKAAFEMGQIKSIELCSEG